MGNYEQNRSEREFKENNNKDASQISLKHEGTEKYGDSLSHININNIIILIIELILNSYK